MALPQADNSGQQLIELLFSLRPPRSPARPVRGPLRRLLPSPLRSLEEWLRFTGQDLAHLTPAQRAHERLRLEAGIGLIEDPGDVPPWAQARLAALRQSSPKRPAPRPAGAIPLEVLDETA